MIEFEFTGTEEALEYVEEIARHMVLLLPVTMDEAVGRINRLWRGHTFLSELEVGMLMHEEPDVWAKTIYYGHNSHWWLGEEGLEPLPYLANTHPALAGWCWQSAGMNGRLRTTAIVYGAVIAIHVADHLRRGIDASPRSVLVLGVAALAFQALAVGAVLTRHRLAAVLALAVALPDAIGVVLVHLLPGGSDALVGDHTAPGATAFSVVTAAAEVVAGLALAWVAWTAWARGGRRA